MNDHLLESILESWTRQSQILMNLASRVDGSNAQSKPSPDGWTIAYHLAHIHEVRWFWLGKVSAEHQAKLGDVFLQEGDEWVPIDDLDEIKHQLTVSSEAVLDAVKTMIEQGVTSVGGYDHPIFFLQHMVWHEGYHFGLIVLALRNAGQEPPEEWEETNVWGLWRTEI